MRAWLFCVVRKTSGMAFIAPNCLPRRSAGVYQCGGNGFFWNPSLTELTERSFSDERRVKNASHRAATPEPLIDNPWQRLLWRRWETVAFPLLIQKIRPDNFGDLFTLLGCLLEVGCFFFSPPASNGFLFLPSISSFFVLDINLYSLRILWANTTPKNTTISQSLTWQ